MTDERRLMLHREEVKKMGTIPLRSQSRADAKFYFFQLWYLGERVEGKPIDLERERERAANTKEEMKDRATFAAQFRWPLW
jgi:hypothetical protein